MLLLRLLVIVIFQLYSVEANSRLPEALNLAIRNSFNNTADVMHLAIETDFKNNALSLLETMQSILEEDWNFKIQIDVNNELGEAVSNHNLWLIDSYKAFKRLLRWTLAYHRDAQLFHFIVLRISNTEDRSHVIETIFSDFLKLSFGNLNIIVETLSGEILFYTFYPYRINYSCRSAMPFILFRYYNTKTDLTTVDFFPSKVDNFHGCPLRIETRNELVLALANKQYPDRLSNYEMSLLELVIIEEVSLLLNSSLDIHRTEDSLISEMFSNGKVDVSLGSFTNNPEESNYRAASVTYFLSWLLIVLQRRPDTLRTLVWLFVPFNLTTWVCTFGFLLLTSGCIFLVRKSRKLMKIFHLENSGGLDILSVTIGASVEHLPRKGCLRFAFLVLSLGALILRSAYLGKLFDAYRKLTIIEPPRNVLQLLAENYTIYAHSIYKPIIDELIGLENIRFEDLAENEKSFKYLSDNEKKNAFVVSYVYIYTFYTLQQRKQMIFKTILQQHVCMFFQQHSIIAPKVNKIIMQMEEAGILQHARQKYEHLKGNFMPMQEKVLKPIPLVLERFAFTFYLFGVLIGISCLIFFLEIVWKKISKKRENKIHFFD